MATMIFSKYDRKPFSGRKYAENSATAGDDEMGCGLCGKPIKTDGHQFWGVVVDGGADWGDKDSSEDDAGYMGAFPIGSDCHRKHFASAAGVSQ